MSKVYDAMMRAQRERDDSVDEVSLHDRLRRWLIRGRALLAQRRAPEPFPEPLASLHDDRDALVEEEIASLRVAVHALDDRLSAEVVEREAKLLEEIRRGMRALENELSERFAAATLEMKRSYQRTAALVVGFMAALAGLVVAVLARL